MNIRRACVLASSKDIQKNGPSKCERTSLRKQLRAGGKPALHYKPLCLLLTTTEK